MDIRVNKLSLSVPGIGALDARRLAEVLARDLAACGASAGPGVFDRLRVDVPRGSSIEALSQNIVQQILRAMARQG